MDIPLPFDELKEYILFYLKELKLDLDYFCNNDYMDGCYVTIKLDYLDYAIDFTPNLGSWNIPKSRKSEAGLIVVGPFEGVLEDCSCKCQCQSCNVGTILNYHDKSFFEDLSNIIKNIGQGDKDG